MALCLAALTGCGVKPQAAAPRPERPNVLLIVVDALRADRLGCYGYPGDTSPQLDRLAQEGVLFTDAMAQGTDTLTSVPTLLTGQRPGEHGLQRVNSRSGIVPRPGPDCPTLAEALRAGGYEPAAFSANPLVNLMIAARRGFAIFDESCSRGPVWLLATAPAVTGRACEWLERQAPAGKPFFLFLHYVDPHNQYRPPSQFCVFGRPGYTPRDHDLNARINDLPATQPDHRVSEEALAEHGLSRADVERLSDLYDGEILFADHHIGQLLRRLRELDLYQDTMVIVTADHGEEFLEHGTLEHGESLYQELIRVPLIVKMPGGQRAKRMGGLVQLADLAPTILEAAGVRPLSAMSGRSFYSTLITGRRPAQGVGFAELPEKKMQAVRAGHLKLIVSPRGVELYDLAQDPREQHNLARSRPREVARLKQELAAITKHRSPVVAAPAPGQREIEALKSLGYLD